MAIEISNANANGKGTRNVQGQAGPGADASRAFFETFRRLPDARYRESTSGLKVAVVREGNGKALSNGMRVKVHYTGWLADGTQFDSSLDRGAPFEFRLGAGRVIKGWEEGLAGIRAGERRQLVIPAELAYGDRQVGDIPPGSTLVFNVEAVAVQDAAANPKGNMNVVA